MSLYNFFFFALFNKGGRMLLVWTLNFQKWLAKPGHYDCSRFEKFVPHLKQRNTTKPQINLYRYFAFRLSSHSFRKLLVIKITEKRLLWWVFFLCFVSSALWIKFSLNKFYQNFLLSSTVLVSRRRTPYSRETRPQNWSRWKSRFSSTRKFVLLKTGVVLVTQHASPEWRCVTAGKDVSHAWRAQRKSAKETGVCQSIAIPLIFIFARRFTLQAWTVTGISFLKARSVWCGTLIQFWVSIFPWLHCSFKDSI